MNNRSNRVSKLATSLLPSFREGSGVGPSRGWVFGFFPRAYIKYIICTAAAWLLPSFGGVGGGFAQTISLQTISNISKSDPLIITGAIGTSNHYYHSSGFQYTSPFNSSAYANLNISLYGITMPVALYYSNSEFNFNYPHIAFNLNPSYKNWQGYFGQSTMQFSNYIMNMSFNGVGIEYKGDKGVRFGAFYGHLRNAINDDPEDLDARMPQYRRTAWGFKVGYGFGAHSLDLYVMRSWDSESSVSEYWRSRISPEANFLVGLRGSSRITKWLSLSANAATSLFTSDSRAESLQSEKLERWDKIFDAKYTSNIRFAGDVSANLMLKNLNTSLYYRMVQPNYKSMGASYMSNNYQSLGLSATTSLLHKVSLGGNFSMQSDNLSKEQLFTNRGFVYSANASTRLGKVGLSARYSGYQQRQYDGSIRVSDSTRVHRIMHSIGGSANYSFQKDILTHPFTLSAAYNVNKDLNKFATGASDVTTISGAGTYNVSVEPWKTDFSGTLNHQQSLGYDRKYTSDIFSLTAMRTFFEENQLHVSATLNLCYNRLEKMRENMSLGGDMQVGWTLNKVHTFSLSGGIARSNDVNITDNESMYNITEINVGLNYTYTFSIFEMKRKAAKEEKKL